MWPRFRLTPEEAFYSIKYADPSKKEVPVLRRIYYGVLDITPTIRQDTETMQISRRCRIHAITASGDVNLIEMQIIDSSGEQYTTDYVPISHLLGGTNYDPRSLGAFNPALFAAPGLRTGFVNAAMGSMSAYVLEPNIVLSPNQTLSLNARPIDPTMTGPLHVSLCFHVWEFPGMPGSPL